MHTLVVEVAQLQCHMLDAMGWRLILPTAPLAIPSDTAPILKMPASGAQV